MTGGRLFFLAYPGQFPALSFRAAFRRWAGLSRCPRGTRVWEGGPA